jgi:hypothetical protein
MTTALDSIREHRRAVEELRGALERLRHRPVVPGDWHRLKEQVRVLAASQFPLTFGLDSVRGLIPELEYQICRTEMETAKNGVEVARLVVGSLLLDFHIPAHGDTP